MAESEQKSPAISLKTGADVDVQFSSDEELGTIEEEATSVTTPVRDKNSRFRFFCYQYEGTWLSKKI